MYALTNLSIFMSTAVKLSSELVKRAKSYAHIYNRSVPKQIEYWSQIVRIAEDNPDLSYSFIKDIMISLDEVQDQKVEPYLFNN